MKKENCKKEREKFEKEEKSMLISRGLFFSLSLFETTEIYQGSIKIEIATKEKHFTLEKKLGKVPAPPPPKKKKRPLAPLQTRDLLSCMPQLLFRQEHQAALY